MPFIKSRKSGTELLLCYPDFNKPVLFHLYIDALNHQLDTVIIKDRKPIAFYSQNLNTFQKWYTNTERLREFLSAIETYKLQGIQEYPDRLPFINNSLYIP
jgi:hypothetical protein